VATLSPPIFRITPTTFFLTKFPFLLSPFPLVSTLPTPSQLPSPHSQRFSNFSLFLEMAYLPLLPCLTFFSLAPKDHLQAPGASLSQSSDGVNAFKDLRSCPASSLPCFLDAFFDNLPSSLESYSLFFSLNHPFNESSSFLRYRRQTSSCSTSC